MPHESNKQCLDDSIMVDTSNGPSLGLVAVVVTARIMSVAQTQVHRCYGSVPFTLCSSDSNPPMSIRRSTTGLRHKGLFGETLSGSEHAKAYGHKPVIVRVQI